MQAKALKTEQYFGPQQIQEYLKTIEYIIMAAPAPEHFQKTPIHFTIFLNTQEELPHEIQKAVLEKFLQENRIGRPSELMSQLMPVGFALSKSQDTPMPMLLVNPQDQRSIPNVVMHIMDFLADSDTFDEVKKDHLTGWSYSYE